MSFSYSKVSTHAECPFKYKCRYVDKLETVPDTRPNNALFAGTACHEGLEHRSVEAALASYMSNYSEITAEHEVEMLKLKTILPRMFEQIPEGIYEYKLEGDDGFVGYIDMLVPVSEGVYDLVDFKYSVSPWRYKSGDQVILYKYYYEKLTGNTIRNIYYAVIPKISKALTEGVDREALEKEIVEKLSDADVTIVPIMFDSKKVGCFFGKKRHMDTDTQFLKVFSNNCKWCEYNKLCHSKYADTSELLQTPENLAKVQHIVNSNVKEEPLW